MVDWYLSHNRPVRPFACDSINKYCPVRLVRGIYSFTRCKFCTAWPYMYHSLMKEGPLWIVHPPASFASIPCWGLNLIWKSTHLAQGLQIGISHCLASLRMWWDWFTHTTGYKLKCCTALVRGVGSRFWLVRQDPRAGPPPKYSFPTVQIYLRLGGARQP